MNRPPSIAALAPLARVRAELLALTRPVAVVRVAPLAAIGAVAAEDVVAGPCPPRATALRAGFALASAESVGASPYAPATPSRLVPVAAGAGVPDGCDAVVPAEAVVEEFGLTALQQSVAPGENLRRAGEDLAAATPLVVSGIRISAAAALLAATLGRTDLAIRRPRLAIVAAENAGPGAAERLRMALAGLPAEFAETDAEPADLHLLVGGAEIGPDDAGLAALARSGARLGHGLALTGLESAAWGEIDGRPALLLPDRPEAAVIARLALVEPLVAALADAAVARAPAPRVLSRKIVSQVGMSEIALLATDGATLRPLAVGSISWAALLAADAFAELPPESEGCAEGAPLAAFPLPAPRSLP